MWESLHNLDHILANLSTWLLFKAGAILPLERTGKRWGSWEHRRRGGRRIRGGCPSLHSCSDLRSGAAPEPSSAHHALVSCHRSAGLWTPQTSTLAPDSTTTLNRACLVSQEERQGGSSRRLRLIPFDLSRSGMIREPVSELLSVCVWTGVWSQVHSQGALTPLQVQRSQPEAMKGTHSSNSKVLTHTCKHRQEASLKQTLSLSNSVGETGLPVQWCHSGMLPKTWPACCRINILGGDSTCEHQPVSNVSNRNAEGRLVES